MHIFPIVVQPSPQLARLIAQALLPQITCLFQKELEAMSSTVTEAVANLEDAAKRVEAQSAAKDQTIADLKAANADLAAKLSAAQAGDPADVSAIDGVTAALTAIAPAPAAPAAEPPVADPNQPAG